VLYQLHKRTSRRFYYKADVWLPLGNVVVKSELMERTSTIHLYTSTPPLTHVWWRRQVNTCRDSEVGTRGLARGPVTARYGSRDLYVDTEG
jgi:hypothetical protein